MFVCGVIKYKNDRHSPYNVVDIEVRWRLLHNKVIKSAVKI